MSGGASVGSRPANPIAVTFALCDVAAESSFVKQSPLAAAVLPALPAVLLAVVALAQIQLARSEHLSPWKGGGFGMFSSSDVQAYRTLRVYGRRGAAAFELPIPDALGDAALRARLFPTEPRLRELGRRLAEEAGEALGPLSGVRVEAWRRRFEADGLVPHPTLLREVELDLVKDEG